MGCFSEQQRGFFETFSANVTLALNNIALLERARVDDVTGLFNKRHMDEQLERQIDRTVRYQRPFSMILLEIDDFVSHQANLGERAKKLILQEVANVLKRQSREVDIVGRLTVEMDGQRFLFILEETNVEEAEETAQRIKTAIAQTVINEPQSGEKATKITASLAVVSNENGQYDSDMSMMDAVESTLGQVKASGGYDTVAVTPVPD